MQTTRSEPGSRSRSILFFLFLESLCFGLCQQCHVCKDLSLCDYFAIRCPAPSMLSRSKIELP